MLISRAWNDDEMLISKAWDEDEPRTSKKQEMKTFEWIIFSNPLKARRLHPLGAPSVHRIILNPKGRMLISRAWNDDEMLISKAWDEDEPRTSKKQEMKT
ncbi:hypothetical protein BGU76_18980, partial [Clostridioides difficile]